MDSEGGAVPAAASRQQSELCSSKYISVDKSAQSEPASGAGADSAVAVLASKYAPVVIDSLSGREGPETYGGLRPAGSVFRPFDIHGGEREVAFDGAAIGSSRPTDRQSEFEAAKRTVALTPHEMQERRKKLEAVGEAFTRDVRETLRDFPPVTLREREGVGGGPGTVIGFTEEDVAAIEEATGLKFVDVGGHAGGIKAVHEGRGLFLKFAFDQEGIYQSATMAAKAAKREAAASRWVHALDSVHLSTPLLQCVDLAVEERKGLGGYRVLRVQVYAKVDVRGFKAGDRSTWESTTLRVGSSDGGVSMNVDDEQVEDVVKPLASHFFLSPDSSTGIDLVLGHSYSSSGEGTGIAAEGGAASTDEQTWSLLDYLVEERGMKEDDVAGLRRDCSEGILAGTAESDIVESAQASEDIMTAGERALADEIQSTIKASGADLGHQVDQGKVQHRVTVLDSSTSQRELQLPFDVEVHQLDNGQRMVLDTHRLLIPDVAWMEWARRSDEARPRVWALHMQRSCESGPAVVRGSLPLECTRYFSTNPRDCNNLSMVLQEWAMEALGTEEASTSLRFPGDMMQQHPDLGSLVAKGVADGTKETMEGPKDHQDPDSIAMVVVVSCPRWYYCGNSWLTCLLPPEAAPRLHKLCPEACRGLSPDRIMCGEAKDIRAALEAQRMLYQYGAKMGPTAVLRELEAEHRCDESLVTVPVDSKLPKIASLPLSSYRKALKRAMHGCGLGLRHARLVMGDDSLVEYREKLYKSVITGNSSVAQSNVSRLAASIVSNLGEAFYLTGLQVAQEAWCFAAKGLVRHGAVVFDTDESMLSTAPMPRDRHAVHSLGSGSSCVGVSMAACRGTDRFSKESGVQAAIRELAHLQRVGCSGQVQYLGLVSLLCSRSSGSWREMLRCRVRQGSVVGAGKSRELALKLYDIAWCLQAMGRYTESFAQFTVCLDIWESSIGKDNAQYANALGGTAVCLESMGRYDEALRLHVRCRDIEGTILGKDHIEYANTLGNIGGCLEQMRKFSEALEVYRECQGIREAALGKQHPDYASALGRIAACLYSMGKYSDALELHLKCRSTLKTTLGEDHPEYAASLSNMAWCLQALGRYDEALQLYQECRSIWKAFAGAKHPSYATTLCSTAVCLQSMDRCEEALELYAECRGIQESTLGRDHPSLSTTLGRMAGCLREMGRNAEALELYSVCLATYEGTSGKETREYATTLNNTAMCLKCLGRYSEALGLHVKCKRIRQSVLGIHHEDYATTIGNIAGCLYSMKRYDEALESYMKLQKAIGIALGKQHRKCINTTAKIASCLLALGRFDEMQAVIGKVEEAEHQFIVTCARSQPNTPSSIPSMPQKESILGKGQSSANADIVE